MQGRGLPQIPAKPPALEVAARPFPVQQQPDVVPVRENTGDSGRPSRPGSPTTTRTGLKPAGDDELTIRS